jgi:hypothetical protein
LGNLKFSKLPDFFEHPGNFSPRSFLASGFFKLLAEREKKEKKEKPI